MDRFAGMGIEIAGGFIGQDDIGTEHQGPGNRHPLLFPAGKFSRPVMHPPGQPHIRQDRRSPSAHACSRSVPRIRAGIMTFSRAENSGSR